MYLLLNSVPHVRKLHSIQFYGNTFLKFTKTKVEGRKFSLALLRLSARNNFRTAENFFSEIW